MAYLTGAIDNYRVRVVNPVQVTGTGTEAYLLPTGGAKAQVLRCIVTMGNATDLALTPKTADDATGTNAAALAADVPIYVNGVRTTDAKAYTIGDSSGNFVVDFVIPPAIIPTDKYIGISYASSNNSNIMTSILLEDVAYKPTAS
jgi:hypothetical protein